MNNLFQKKLIIMLSNYYVYLEYNIKLNFFTFLPSNKNKYFVDTISLVFCPYVLLKFKKKSKNL